MKLNLLGKITILFIFRHSEHNFLLEQKHSTKLDNGNQSPVILH